MRLSFLGVLATCLAAGCGGSTDNPSDAGGADGAGGADSASTEAGAHDGAANDGQPTADASTEASDAAQACNALANSAQSITYQQVASDPPTATGGTPVDGTYTMTDAAIYTGPNGPTGPSGMSQTTIQIAGSTIQIVSDGQPATRTVTLATSDSHFTATDTCPDTMVTQGQYTATATTMVIQLDGGTDDAGARTVVETFTKQ